MPILLIPVFTLGWYTIIGKRRSREINYILSPDGSIGFTTDGTTLISTI